MLAPWVAAAGQPGQPQVVVAAAAAKPVSSLVAEMKNP
jgi:hypothetical protein